MFGSNGMGWGGGNNALQNALTRSDLQQDLNTMTIQNGQDIIMNEIGAFERDATATWGNIRYDNLQNSYALQGAINQNRFDQLEQNCVTNRNIDNVRSEAYRNTCEITGAIHAEGEATRALITQNTIQELRDKLEDRDRQLLLSNLTTQNQELFSNIVNTIRPCAVPAYITCSPYTSNNCGCGMN